MYLSVLKRSTVYKKVLDEGWRQAHKHTVSSARIDKHSGQLDKGQIFYGIWLWSAQSNSHISGVLWSLIGPQSFHPPKIQLSCSRSGLLWPQRLTWASVPSYKNIGWYRFQTAWYLQVQIQLLHIFALSLTWPLSSITRDHPISSSPSQVAWSSTGWIPGPWARRKPHQSPQHPVSRDEFLLTATSRNQVCVQHASKMRSNQTREGKNNAVDWPGLLSWSIRFPRYVPAAHQSNASRGPSTWFA